MELPATRSLRFSEARTTQKFHLLLWALSSIDTAMIEVEILFQIIIKIAASNWWRLLMRY